MKLNPILSAGALLALVLAVNGAQAQQNPGAAAPDRQARVWAASCNACHGTDGASKGGIPPINGRDADSLYRALIEFKTGQRPAATVMHQHAKGYTDEELQRIARHFASASNTAAAK